VPEQIRSLINRFLGSTFPCLCSLPGPYSLFLTTLSPRFIRVPRAYLHVT